VGEDENVVPLDTTVVVFGGAVLFGVGVSVGALGEGGESLIGGGLLDGMVG
jgi:hypothetical protein